MSSPNDDDKKAMRRMQERLEKERVELGGAKMKSAAPRDAKDEESEWEEVKKVLASTQEVIGVKLLDDNGEPSTLAYAIMGVNVLLPLFLLYQVFSALSALIKPA